jgi:hypothetical protein
VSECVRKWTLPTIGRCRGGGCALSASLLEHARRDVGADKAVRLRRLPMSATQASLRETPGTLGNSPISLLC